MKKLVSVRLPVSLLSRLRETMPNSNDTERIEAAIRGYLGAPEEPVNLAHTAMQEGVLSALATIGPMTCAELSRSLPGIKLPSLRAMLRKLEDRGAVNVTRGRSSHVYRAGSPADKPRP